MKHLALVSALAVMFGAATYSVKLNPGDTVTVEAVTATQPPTPAPTDTIPIGVNLPGPDEWNMGARACVRRCNENRAVHSGRCGGRWLADRRE